MGMGKFAERVRVDIVAPGAPNRGAFQGFHVHAVGQRVVPFTSAAPHFNPEGVAHGKHTGDLPSLLITRDGEAHAEFETVRFNVNDLFVENCSAVVLHEKPDNFASIPTGPTGYLPAGPIASTNTGISGDAGPRYACGVVQRI